MGKVYWRWDIAIQPKLKESIDFSSSLLDSARTSMRPSLPGSFGVRCIQGIVSFDEMDEAVIAGEHPHKSAEASGFILKFEIMDGNLREI
jgi:hypothetical protein